MKKFRLLSPFKFFSLGLLAAAGCLLPAPLTRAAGFSPGNLAVEYCPNNSSASTTFAILELSPNTAGQSAPVNSNSIPSTGASALRQSASAGTTGYLSTTADGTLLVFTAFEDAAGVSDETTILPRGVATLDSGTNYTLQSSYTGASGSQTRGATSLDNKTWLIADKGGVYTNGASAPVNVTNVIDAKAFGSTVYFLSQKSTTVISALSADATSLNLMTGLPADAATADFYLVSSGNNGTYDVLYYIDETSASAGTIFKYSLVGSTWTANGSYTTSFGGDGLCAALNGSGGTYLYVTTGKGGTSANKVIKLNDTAGYNSTLAITTANNITLYTTPSGTTLKGIAFAPIAPVGSSLPPPTLTAATGATVDSSFTVTFTENSAWRLGITNILVGATTLPTSAYSTTVAGQITFTPSASALLQTAGTLTITIGSTGYNLDKVFQNVGAGAAKKLGITAQPAAPSASGGTLVAQPSVVIQDQYGNNLSSASAITVTATVSGTAGWTLGGTTAQVTAGGIAAFTDLSASVSGSAEVDGVTITFTSSDVTISSATSAAFNILRPPTAFTSGNLAVLQADTAAGNNSTISILELNPSALNASPVNIVPISATGANALRISGASGTTGRLADSGDGSLVALAAFADGSSATADETTINQRGVGALAANASFSLRCSYTGLGSPTDNQARGATSLDNNTWYISDKGGIYTNNLNTPANTTNVRSIRSFGGSVYVLSANTTVISRVSADGTQLTPLASLPTDASAVDFYMVSSQNNGVFDTIYWLDATGKSAGTIYKYSSTDGGTTWSSQGNWPTPNGGDGFCAATNGSGGAYLYYTTGAGGLSGNSLIELTDSANRDATINIIATNTLYTAASTATLKGIAFAPVALSAAPVAITLTASNITAGSATLNASINPGGAATTYWFRYGTTTGYGSFSATNTLAAGSSPVTVTAPLTGLLQGTTYHFLVVATNSGGTSSATDASFTALPVTPPNVGGLSVSGDAFRLAFTNATGASFSVLATNNLTAPKSTWPVVGQAVESPAGSGSYQFTNTVATNSVLFYIVRQP